MFYLEHASQDELSSLMKEFQSLTEVGQHRNIISLYAAGFLNGMCLHASMEHYQTDIHMFDSTTYTLTYIRGVRIDAKYRF